MNFQNLKKQSFLRIFVVSLLVLSSASAGATSSSFQKRFQRRDEQERFGVNVEPLWLAVGGIGAKGEYFLSNKISVGLGGVYIPSHKVESSTNDSTGTASSYQAEHSEIVLGSNIMLTGTLQTDGFYLNPGVGYQKTAISHYSSLDLAGSLNSPFARLTAGYQWITTNKIRIGLGAGATMLQTSDVVVADNSGREVYREKASGVGGLALDIHVGYIF